MKAEVIRIAPLILTLRGQKVILDSDLAKIYGVRTKVLNQAVKRNIEKFPKDFMFRLTRGEADALISQIVISTFDRPNRSQIVTGSQKHRDPRLLPNVFTEHGAFMAANVLRSERAVHMSVFVVRAFVRLREMYAAHKELAEKLRELERKVAEHDHDIGAIVEAIRQLMQVPEKPKRQIGFRVQDPRLRYIVRKKA